MEKIITTPFEFLDKQITKVNCKFILQDSKKQQVLTCDLYADNVLVYQDKAYILGTLPFELTGEDIEEIRIQC